MHWFVQKKSIKGGIYMFDKYFGFLRSHDEVTILDALLEHSKIDEEELLLLTQMIHILLGEDSGDLNAINRQICTINRNNAKSFETLSDHIIQSNFDFQKQYDLLRLQQRIDVISSLIIATARRVLILMNTNGTIPSELNYALKPLVQLVLDSHQTFIMAMEKYKTSRKEVIDFIHTAMDQETMVDNARSECLETLYKLANEDQLKLGDFRAIESIIEYLEDISDSIKSAVTSLDWLLLN